MLLPLVNRNACGGGNNFPNSLAPMEKSAAKKKPAKPKKMLTPEQQADAARLKRLWMARHGDMSQEAFGQKYNLGGQGNVTQHINGFIPLNLDATIKFAHFLDVQVSEISPVYGEVAALVRTPINKEIMLWWDKYKALDPGMKKIVDFAMWGKDRP